MSFDINHYFFKLYIFIVVLRLPEGRAGISLKIMIPFSTIEFHSLLS